MDINAIKLIATQVIGRGGLLLQKYSPEILLGLGLVSGVTGTVLACKATLKVEAVLEESEKRVKAVPVEDKQELTKVYIRNGVELVKLYGPAASFGVTSVACILTGHNIMQKRNMALIGAYKLVEKAFKEYRERVVEEYGEKIDRNLKYGIKQETVTEIVEGEDGKKKKVKATIDVLDPNTLSQYSRFFDSSCPNWSKNPEYNLYFLKAQQNFANDMLRSRGHVFLNEVYESLGLPHTEAGAIVGWVLGDGDNFIDFGIYDPDSLNARDFVNGYENVILLDFNVDGVMYNLI